MFGSRKVTLAALAVLVLAHLPAGSLLAQDAPRPALLIGNAEYRAAPAARGAARLALAVPGLRGAGFDVTLVRDASAQDMRGALSTLLRQAAGAERLLVALSGHFVHSGRETWFLGIEADTPDLVEAAATGVALSTLLEIAGKVPGGALVLLGTESRAASAGTGLAAGLGPFDIPQGVTVIIGPSSEIAALARGSLTRQGISVAELARARPGLSARGFVSNALPFVPEGPPPAPADERAEWQAARETDTAEAYRAHLAAWPQGRFAAEALAAISRLEEEARAGTAGADPEAREAALNLPRGARQAIQRDLSILGFNTRGIDGIFGPGTRAAIRGWQLQESLEVTGFLDAFQITRLEARAAVRAAELEAEAEARRAAQESADRAFWQATGAAGDEAGLRAYLARHPDGLFAEVAQQRIAAIEEARGEGAAARDRADWNRARSDNTIAAYRAYLEAWPSGAFSEPARARIAALEEQEAGAGAQEAARREEEALGLNPFTRNLIESRLDALGLEPGAVDGQFDAATRRAIRRYQRARDLPETGYVSEALLVRLLADSFRIRLE
ncbi:MAG: peptidoglycan-binding protein [Rhodobacteraceae bacterium]|nr:peptidoglycan-binding protein [Paracoccaceae bacterium]